ncbi:toprim domain-containing protein [Longirhabdus pacifica]|uniref:toprim domain-containing protein n=1 Tax=Longirhabdus pacifica TaxID=2305227 RepID=UPI0010092DFB|nr:toprim domain-containing protein [Longirhabdus pacifica]
MVIVVEGKNDRKRLKKLLTPQIDIICTFGTPSSNRLDQIRKQVGSNEVYIFTDNDASGKKIRAKISDLFPDATHLYTKKGYCGVEGTPEEYLIERLEKGGLQEYILYPESTDNQNYIRWHLE